MRRMCIARGPDNIPPDSSALQHVDSNRNTTATDHRPGASVCQSGESGGLPRPGPGSGNLVRTVDERAAEGTRGNPKDADSTGGLTPKGEGDAVLVSSPDLREGIGQESPVTAN